MLATQPDSEFATAQVKQYVRFGSSPRGAQALLLSGKVNALREGRFNLSFADIETTALHALRHRVLLNFEAEAEGITSDMIVQDVLKNVKKSERVR